MSDVDAGAGRFRPFSGRPSAGRVSQAAMSRIGLVLAVAAALWFTEGGLRGAVCGSLLLAAVLATDLLAHRMRIAAGRLRRDRLDLWLAVMLARLREYAVFAGLAIGGAVAGVADAWAWAAGALIAVALRDSITAAREARLGDPEWTANGGADWPVGAADPSRHGAGQAPGDDSLAAELLGGAGDGGDRGGGSSGDTAPEPDRPDTPPEPPLRIRTLPKGAPWPGWRAGRAETLGPGAGAEDGGGPAEPGAAPQPGAARSAPHSGPVGPGILRRARLPFRPAMDFPQAARFGVVAVTILIWDVRVTFVALIVGCALAVTAELVGNPTRDIQR
ncbi:hypothetical protein GCM10027570_36080 [Streptomonospora sediminis]